MHPSQNRLDTLSRRAVWACVLMTFALERPGRQAMTGRRRGRVRDEPGSSVDPVGAAPSDPHQLTLTLIVFVVLAGCFWVNATVNRYRFNVALALLASLPLLVLLIRAAVTDRQHRTSP